MLRILAILLVLGGLALAQTPAEAPCATCTAEGKSHGNEPVAATLEYEGKTYYFCHEGCKERFAANPSTYLQKSLGDFGRLEPWSVTDSKGQTHSSADYQGKVLVIDLWATWCPPCVKEIPEFMELQEKQGAAGLQFLGLSFDKDSAAHDTFLTDQKLNYPSALASEAGTRALLKQLQGRIGAIKAIPVTLVIDRQGTIRYRKVGLVDADFQTAVKAALEAR